MAMFEALRRAGVVALWGVAFAAVGGCGKNAGNTTTGCEECLDHESCGTEDEPGYCDDGCCQDSPPSGTNPGQEGTNDCHAPTRSDVPCPPDQDITALEGSCTAEAATVRMTVAGGAPVAVPTDVQKRQCELGDADYANYVVLMADANAGPYTCSAMVIRNNGFPETLALGAGDSCGVSGDGSAIEFVLTAASAGFTPTQANCSSVGGAASLSDSAGPIPLDCSW